MDADPQIKALPGFTVDSAHVQTEPPAIKALPGFALDSPAPARIRTDTTGFQPVPPTDAALAAGYTAAAPASTDTRTKLINFLLRPRGTTYDVQTPEGGVDKFGTADESAPTAWIRKRIGAGASMLLHPWDSVKAMVTQPYQAGLADLDVLTHPGSGGPTGNTQQIIQNRVAELQQKADSGQASAKERQTLQAYQTLNPMLDQVAHGLKTDPVGTVADFAVQGAIMHGVSELAGMTKAAITKPGSPALVDTSVLPGEEPPPPPGGGGAAPATSPAPLPRWLTNRKVAALRRILNVAPLDSARDARTLGEVNAARAADYQQALGTHMDNVRDVGVAQAAEDDAHAQTMQDLRDKVSGDERVGQQQYQQDLAEHSATQDAAEAAGPAHADLLDQLEQNRQQELSQRKQLHDSVLANKRTAKVAEGGLWNAVRRKVNGGLPEPASEAAAAAGTEAPTVAASTEPVAAGTTSAEPGAAAAAATPAAPAPAPAPFNTTPIAPLLEAVTSVTDPDHGMLAGSQPKIRIFEDILRRAKQAATVSVVDGARRDVMDGQGYPGTVAYEDLSPEKQSMVDQVVKSDLAARAASMDEAAADPASPDAGQDLSFDHLRGYSSELGRAAYAEDEGDIRRALFHVKGVVDGMIDHLAEQSGATADLAAAKNATYTNRRVFQEGEKRTAGNGEVYRGSPVARAVQKAPNHFQSTSQLIPKDPVTQAETRQLLTGGDDVDFLNGRGTVYQNPETGHAFDQLLDTLQEKKRLQAAAKEAAATAKSAAKAGGKAAPEPPLTTADRAAALTSKYQRPVRYNPDTIKYEFTDTGTSVPEQPGLPKPPAPKTLPVPKPPTPPALDSATLDRITGLRREQITKSLDRLREFTKQDVYNMASGSVGFAMGLLSVVKKANPWLASLELGTGVAQLSRALTPKVLGEMLSKPEIVEKLARPSLADLRQWQALPEADRPGVAEAIRVMSEEAQRRGKIKRPSPWLVLLAATSGPARKQAEQQGSQSQSATDAAEQAQLDAIQRQIDSAQGAWTPADGAAEQQ